VAETLPDTSSLGCIFRCREIVSQQPRFFGAQPIALTLDHCQFGCFQGDFLAGRLPRDHTAAGKRLSDELFEPATSLFHYAEMIMRS
jgi:hypothetical protein